MSIIPASQSHHDLFFEALIQSYIQGRYFVERPWLAEQIGEALAEPTCRFLLLTASPGVGKTAFMAWLAHQHANWPRYFIRRDQRTPLEDVGARSLLLHIGFQLAASYPTIFKGEGIKVVIEQRIEAVGMTGEIVGIEAKRILASPFYQTVAQIQQKVTQNDGNIVGIRTDEWITTPRLLPLDDLQYMALIDPAKVLLTQSPGEQIVILVDALDEVRYRDTEQTLLSWLATCPELPPNVRFVLTSRPDDEILRRFREAQQPWLKVMSIGATDPNVLRDLQTYALALTGNQEMKAVLEKAGRTVDDFVRPAVEHALGNIGYLDAVGRAMDQLLARHDQQALTHFLDLSRLPDTLEGLYAFFLHQLKDLAGQKSLRVEDDETGQIYYPSAWSSVYLPTLAVLAVARESLTAEQINNLGGIQADWSDFNDALNALGQFLNQKGNRYSLYHTTMIEFLTAEETKRSSNTQDLYLDATKWQKRIVRYYRGKARTWQEVAWDKIDDSEGYGLRNIGTHLYALRNIEAYGHDLDTLICKPFMQVTYDRFGSYQVFTENTLLLIEMATRATPPDLVQKIRGNLIYVTLKSITASVPPAILKTLVQIGYTTRALGFVEMFQNASIRSQTYFMLGKALLVQKDTELACMALEQALVAAQKIEEEEEQIHVLVKIAPLLVKVSQVEQLLTAVKPIARKTEILAAVALILAQDGQADQTLRVVEQIKEIFDKDEEDDISELTGRPSPFLVLTATEPPMGKRDLVMKIALALIQHECSNQALWVVRQIKDPFDQVDMLETIVETLKQSRQPAQIKSLLTILDNDGLKAMALTALAEMVLRSEEKEQAATAANQALSLLSSCIDDEQKMVLLSSLAQVMAELGEKETANAIINQMKMMAEKEEDATWEMTVMITTVEALTLLERFDEAMEIMQMIEDPAVQTDILVGMIRALIRIEKIDRALELAMEWLIGRGNIDQEFNLSSAEISNNAELDDIDRDLDEDLLFTLSDVGQVQEELSAALIQKHQFKLALDMVKEMKKGSIAEAALQQIATVLGESSGQAYTESIASRLLEVAQLIGAARIFEDIGEALALSIDSEHLLVLAQTMGNQGDKIRLLKSAAMALMRKGQFSWAINMIEAISLEAPLIQINNVAQKSKNPPFNPYDYLEETSYSYETSRAMDTLEDTLHALTSELAEALGQGREQIEDITARVLMMAEKIEHKEIKAMMLSELAQALMRSGNGERACSLVEQALTIAHTLDNPEKKALALSSVVRAWSQIGDEKQTQMTISEVRELLTALGVAAYEQRLLDPDQLPDRMEDLPSEVSLDAGNMETPGVDKSILEQVVLYLIQAGQFDQAMSLVTTYAVEKESRQKANALAAIARTLFHHGLFQQALSVTNAISNEKKQVDTLVSLIRSWMQAERFDQALVLAQEIKDTQVKEQIIDDIYLMQIQRAMRSEQFGQIVSLAGFVKDNAQKAEIIHLLVQSNQITQALMMVNMLNDEQWKTDTLSDIARAIAQTEQASQAPTLLHVINDESTRAGALSYVAQILVIDKQVDLGLTMIQAIDHKMWKVIASMEIASILSEIGEKARALAVARSISDLATLIDDEQQKALPLSIAALSFARIGEKEQATANAEEALTLLQMIESQDDEGFVLRSVVLTFTYIGQIERALDIVKMIEEGENGIDILNEMIHTLLQTGRPSMALKVAEVWEQQYTYIIFIEEIKDVDVPEYKALKYIFKEIIRAFVQAGQTEEILTLTSGLFLLTRDEVLQEMVLALVETQQIKRAFEIMEEIAYEQKRKKWEEIPWRDAVAKLLVRLDQVDQGLIAIQAMKNWNMKIAILYGLILALAEVGQAGEAVKVAQMIEDKLQKAVMLSEAVQVLVQVGRKEEGDVIAMQVQSLLVELEDNQWKTDIQEKVALILVQVGQVQQGLKEAQAITDKLKKMDVLKGIAQLLLQEQNREKVVDVAMLAVAEIKSINNNNKWKVDTLGEWAEILTNAGDHEKALQVLHNAFALGKQSGRETIFNLLEHGAITIGAIDQGQTLWYIYEAMEDVDGWWSIK